MFTIPHVFNSFNRTINTKIQPSDINQVFPDVVDILCKKYATTNCSSGLFETIAYSIFHAQRRFMGELYKYSSFLINNTTYFALQFIIYKILCLVI